MDGGTEGGRKGGREKERAGEANHWIFSLCLVKSLKRNVKCLVLVISVGHFLTSKYVSGCIGQTLS